MSIEFYILAKDLSWLDARIKELEQAIQDLGPDFYDVFNQSSETWHDNAPFDALRDKQSVLFAEYSNLRTVRQKARLYTPNNDNSVVSIGKYVNIGQKRFRISGDWTQDAGKTHNDTTTVSRQSPLAQEIIGKPIGTPTKYGIIEDIVSIHDN